MVDGELRLRHSASIASLTAASSAAVIVSLCGLFLLVITVRLTIVLVVKLHAETKIDKFDPQSPSTVELLVSLPQFQVTKSLKILDCNMSLLRTSFYFIFGRKF